MPQSSFITTSVSNSKTVVDGVIPGLELFAKAVVSANPNPTTKYLKGLRAFAKDCIALPELVAPQFARAIMAANGDTYFNDPAVFDASNIQSKITAAIFDSVGGLNSADV